MESELAMESYTLRHHVFNNIWTATIGAWLPSKREGSTLCVESMQQQVVHCLHEYKNT